jgi:hypothetical protein
MVRVAEALDLETGAGTEDGEMKRVGWRGTYILFSSRLITSFCCRITDDSLALDSAAGPSLDASGELHASEEPPTS